jgi:hypothetical protein
MTSWLKQKKHSAGDNQQPRAEGVNPSTTRQLLIGAALENFETKLFH